MNEPSVIALDERRRRGRTLSRAVAARARLRVLDAAPRPERAGGRAWINGREVGGRSLGYLTEIYD